MNTHTGWKRAALVLGLMATPAVTSAQVSDTTGRSGGIFDSEAAVVRHDLSGPRLGLTFVPDGTVRSQFGWHFERQAAPAARGPWFIVETVLLVGGVERHEFLPSASLIFGIRLPDDYEFGLGPNVSLGGRRGGSTALVIAAGRSFRAGGIRVPVNLAVALNRDSQRVSIVTGWAIRDPEGKR